MNDSMQTQEQGAVDSTKVSRTQVEDAIARSQNYLLSLQSPDGYWWAELESNVTITAEVVLLHKLWGTDKTRPLHKVEAYLRSQQREHGGWELFYGDGGLTWAPVTRSLWMYLSRPCASSARITLSLRVSSLVAKTKIGQQATAAIDRIPFLIQTS